MKSLLCGECAVIGDRLFRDHTMYFVGVDWGNVDQSESKNYCGCISIW